MKAPNSDSNKFKYTSMILRIIATNIKHLWIKKKKSISFATF